MDNENLMSINGLNPTPSVTPNQTCYSFYNVRYGEEILVPGVFSGNSEGISNIYPVQFIVTGLTGTITKVTVRINGYNTDFAADIAMCLVSPKGQYSLLVARNGYENSGYNLDDVILDDDASLGMWSGYDGGTWKPNTQPYDSFTFFSGNTTPKAPSFSFLNGQTYNGLSAFKGLTPLNSNGTWGIFIQDFFVSGDNSSINYIELIICTNNIAATPRPTPTPTKTKTPTPTKTRTTPTPTPTKTKTPTPTKSRTTPTPTPTKTKTPTPTKTRTTPTPTKTRTTPTPTPTKTKTPTPTKSRTVITGTTATPTPTPTKTKTPTPTKSRTVITGTTATPTPTKTKTPTPTKSRTVITGTTATPTPTKSRTVITGTTATPTPTPTKTKTPTPTKTRTILTPTPSSTLTGNTFQSNFKFNNNPY